MRTLEQAMSEQKAARVGGWYAAYERLSRAPAERLDYHALEDIASHPDQHDQEAVQAARTALREVVNHNDLLDEFIKVRDERDALKNELKRANQIIDRLLILTEPDGEDEG